jgi:hypothetical protein
MPSEVGVDNGIYAITDVLGSEVYNIAKFTIHQFEIGEKLFLEELAIINY